MVTKQQLESIGELIRRHGPSLVLYARQWSNSPEDVVQEAYIALLKQTPWPERPTAWLHKAVKHRALNSLRSTKRRERHEQQAQSIRQVWFESSVANRLDAEIATKALSMLGDEEREVVIARVWGELTFEEIAELANTSAATAYRRYESGLRKLRSHLDPEKPKSPVMGQAQQ